MITLTSPSRRGNGLVFCAALFASATFGAQAQDTAAAADLPEAKTLIAAALDFCGGKEKLEAIKSSLVKGSAEVPGAGMIELVMKRSGDDKMLMSQTMAGQEMGGAGRVGKVGWQFNPMMGGYQLLSDEELDELTNQTNMTSLSLLNIEKEFKELKTVGTATFEERECYKVHAVNKSDQEADLFFDVESKSLLGQEQTQESPFGPMEVKVAFRKWKEFDGIKTFTVLAIEQGGQPIELTLGTIEFNTLKEADFVIPDDVKKLVEDKKATEKKEDDDGDADGGGDGGH